MGLKGRLTFSGEHDLISILGSFTTKFLV